ncbi:MAG: UTRA domain-containing protein [Ilumatobacteraceae bacterium]
MPQRLESLGTIEAQLETSGRDAQRRARVRARETPAHVRRVLGAAKVLRVKRVNLADGEPFAVVTVWCPAELGERFSLSDVERHPFYELLDGKLRGATQTIGADIAHADEADLLAVPIGAPLLKCRRGRTTPTVGRS